LIIQEISAARRFLSVCRSTKPCVILRGGRSEKQTPEFEPGGISPLSREFLPKRAKRSF
jgi:hypothetical protein